MNSTRGPEGGPDSDPDGLDFARDIPTTKSDREFLRRSASGGENLLVRLDRLNKAVASLGLEPGRETHEGWKPFELDEVD